jgi:hypothetical protein
MPLLQVFQEGLSQEDNTDNPNQLILFDL